MIRPGFLIFLSLIPFASMLSIQLNLFSSNYLFIYLFIYIKDGEDGEITL